MPAVFQLVYIGPSVYLLSQCIGTDLIKSILHQ